MYLKKKKKGDQMDKRTLEMGLVGRSVFSEDRETLNQM